MPDSEVTLPAAPLQVLLIDRQTRLGPQGSHQFHRSLRLVTESAGLSEAAQFQVSFHPQYQKLVLHQVAVWRSGHRIDKLDRSKVRLLQRETQLERQMLDGRLTASLVLDDVRVGDRVEWAVSVVGDNPVFGGRFVDLDWSASLAGPTALYQYRLLAPAQRAIRHLVGDAGIEVATRMVDGERETLFRRRSAPQIKLDPMTSGGHWTRELVQLSEFADWAAVAQWASEQFAAATQPGPEVRAQADAIRAQTVDPAERLRRALDLVQGDVRYFGTEIGAASHRPSEAEKVLKQRYGDCKDKAALLVALLQAMEIESTPVLVSNWLRRSAAQMLPSPLAFDHAIASVRLANQTLWLDGTRSHQAGPASSRQVRGLGVGLLAQGSATAPTPLPEFADTLRVETVDTLRFDKLAEPGTLEARHVYHGETAEFVRALLASQPKAEFDRAMSSDYTRVYTSAVPDGPSVIEQDAERDTVTVTHRFSLPSYWRMSEQRGLTGEFALVNLITAIRLPDQTPRSRPLRLQLPGVHRHSVVYQFGEEMFPKPVNQRFDESNRFFDLHIQYDMTRDSERIDGELRLMGDELEVADWASYRDLLTKVAPRLGASFSVPAIGQWQMPSVLQELRALDEGLKRGKVKANTAVQREALVRVVALNAQIAGDRLLPKLRAEALLSRGVQFDHLGRHAEAANDFEAALALQPDSVEVEVAIATNALAQRQYDRAATHATKVLARSPNHAPARHVRSYANYFLGDYAKARDDLDELLKSRAEQERGYAAIWLYLVTRRLGGDGAAALKSAWPTASRPAWPYPVLQWLDGRADLAEALRVARDDASASAGRQTELYFYASQKQLLDGDVAGARQSLRRALDLGVVEFNEYAMARRTLEELDAR